MLRWHVTSNFILFIYELGGKAQLLAPNALRNTIDHGFHVPHGKYNLVDAGYANMPRFLAPYGNTNYHLLEKS